jgi:hypothetical protein
VPLLLFSAQPVGAGVSLGASLAVGGLAVGLFRRRPDPSDPVPPTGIRGYDLAVLDAMREGGVDLTKPRGVEFFMLLPDSAAASAAADEAAVRGWDTRIDEPGPDEDLDAWDVHCMRSNVGR